MQAESELLKVKNVRKEYTRGKLFSAVNNVSFSLAEGDFACIKGKSGSGKTTLLNMIAGITTPTNGRITINNTDVFSLDDKLASSFRNRHIGYVPQGGSLLANLTAIENICLPFYLYSQENSARIVGKTCIDRAKELLALAEVSYLSDMFPAHLSGGEMRRVAIIRSLICSPSLVLADEPTNDLDDESSQAIMQLFTQINQQGTTVLMVSHDSDIASYAKHQFKMVSGQLKQISEI